MKDLLSSVVNKRNVTVMVIIIGLLSTYFLYQSSSFDILSITPNNKNFPNSLHKVIINFNRPIAISELSSRNQKDPKSVITTNIPGNNTLTFSEKSLEIIFEKTPETGLFEIRLISIPSKEGNKKLDKTLQFEFKDIPYTELSDADKKMYDDFSTIAEEPPIGQKIVELLPHQTDNYLIQYIYPPEESDESTGIILVTMKFFPETIASQELTEEQSLEYINKIRTYRSEAINWLKSNGFNLDEYNIEYSETELVEEFPAGKESTGDDL
jgi:hypothetical protein